MTPEEWRDLKVIWESAIELAPADRAAYLEAQPPAVRHEIESLIRAYDENSAFLEVPCAPEPSVPSDTALIGKTFGPYRVLAHLGMGGMGSVWLAERIDGLFARRVALKLVHQALMGRVMAERVSREREILASLNHPNIARLFDAGFSEDGQPYLALEYVAGTPFTAYCDNRSLIITERLKLFQQVLTAVQYAHARLVIHRDLKPSNILVTEEGQVQLLDFGIAKLLTEGEARETELTRLGGRALTPDYAAPEQITGAPITTAADVYSLGVMLYEILTGERPYRPRRNSRGALEEAILEEEPVAPSRATPSEEAATARGTTVKKLSRALTGDLDTIAIKALKKSPTERYATANAFGEDIARFLSGEVVLARRDSLAYVALKLARRHRVAIAVAGVLLLTLAGGLAATTYEAEVASAQRDAALQAQLRSLTQTAAARLSEADVAAGMGIILEVLPHRGTKRYFTPEALSVFQEARAADRLVLAFSGHTGAVQSAAFSPDGLRIITASSDKTVRLWDAMQGREIPLLSGQAAMMTSAMFSNDGRRFVTASSNDGVRLYDTATGRQLLQLNGHTATVASAAFSPDGQQILTASHDKTARLWDAATGRQILLLSGHTDRLRYAAFSPDGRRIVTASYDKTARVWDAATGRQLALLNGHTDRLWSAVFSPDGLRVATASGDKTARLWDAATGREILLLSGHTDWVLFAAFSPDGQRVVTASTDKTARVWDAATGQPILLLSGHTGPVRCAAFSPDGRRVVTASGDNTARLWDTGTAPQIQLLKGHTGLVVRVAYSPDGRRVVTASDDKTARVWDAATGQVILALNGHTDWVLGAVFSPDGRRIVTASYDRTARVWDAETGRQTLALNGHTGNVENAAFSPDGRRIVTASYDKTARVWDAETGAQILLLSGHSDRVQNAAFSPDGRRIVTASNDKTVRIWDAATGQQIPLLIGHTDVVGAAGFSPDGRRVVTASDDMTARLWDAATGQQTLLLSGHTAAVNSALFSPDGRRIVTSSYDKTARIWDTATGQQTLLLSGHTGPANYAAFSPDGRHVVTASDDQTARIWDTRTPALRTQIAWAEAAQFDTLSSTERYRLGLPAAADARRWPADASKCDQSAAAPYDPDRRAPGAMLDGIVGAIAVAACADDHSPGDKRRSLYQHGRALMAAGNPSAARRDFDEALAHGYRAAGIELGMLFSQPSHRMLDVPRAISLYVQAWNQGVAIAAYELGNLYEHGVSRADDDNDNDHLLAPDEALAWSWYSKGAEAGEPNALARVAERDDGAAVSAVNPAMRNSYLLQSFTQYAAAAERARRDDWPDDAWRNWRYHRASRARVLEREGMMQQVADAYDEICRQSAAQPTLWERLASITS